MTVRSPGFLCQRHVNKLTVTVPRSSDLVVQAVDVAEGNFGDLKRPSAGAMWLAIMDR